jgi:hypothetical protein
MNERYIISSRNTPKAIAIREVKWNTIMEKFPPSSIRKSKKVSCTYCEMIGYRLTGLLYRCDG